MTTRKGRLAPETLRQKDRGDGMVVLWVVLWLSPHPIASGDRDTYGKIILLLLNFCFLRRMHVINSIGVNRHR